MRGLSVIIPSKTASNFIASGESVYRREPEAKIILVDDGVNLEGLPCTVVEGIKPFIFARNCNLGILAAGEDDVVLMNDDCLLETTGGFSLLQFEAQAHEEYGIIGATTNVTGQPLQQRQNIGLREVPHIAFVCVLIPRRTIEMIGMLDERYCLDYGVEDRDYCQAVTMAGLKVGVHDGCFVDHSKLVSSFRGDPRTSKSYARNFQLYCEKWGVNA